MHIANLLNTGQPEQLVFAGNTHELLFRVLSGFNLGSPLKIVTTDSEFHSFNRQINRLDELSNIRVVRVATLPFEDFTERFAEEVTKHQPDLVFLSQVFFNSGMMVPNLEPIVSAVTQPETLIMVDGYHAFAALPINIQPFCDRIFYLGGGYKYAQGGEGCCFMHVPKGVLTRPLYTGWYAEFGELQKSKNSKVNYSTDAFHYAGSTMDYSALYRQLSVFDLWQSEGVDVSDIHRHVKAIQNCFLMHLDSLELECLNSGSLLMHDIDNHGHFLTFQLSCENNARSLYQYLKHHRILTDYRGDRLRFGFGSYHEASDIDLKCLEAFDG